MKKLPGASNNRSHRLNHDQRCDELRTRIAGARQIFHKNFFFFTSWGSFPYKNNIAGARQIFHKNFSSSNTLI
jgi:hypothetical protein